MDNTNPLRHFRSYSYHHILCACKTTAAAESLSKTLTEDLRDRPGAVQDPDNIVVVDDYVVVSNGFRDGETYIKSIDWETMFAPNSGPNNRYRSTTMALEGAMTVVEPRGFSLLETINNISKVLGVSTSNITWAIKTVFIGYKTDNTMDYITNLKPLLFMIYDLQAKFDVTGSEYYIKFIGSSNGSAKLPCYNSVGAVSLSFGGTTTIADAMRELVTVLNSKYSDEVAAMQKRAASKEFVLEGRTIVYNVVVPDKYAEYAIDNIIASQRGNIDTSGSIKFNRGSNIESMIHDIMRSSKQVNADAAKDTGTVDTIFKIYSETTFVGDDTGTLNVTYYIKPYDVPKATSQTDINIGVATAIEYDYMYSGRNIDILDFDIKMEFGMGFMQMLTVNNPLTNTNPIEGQSNNTQDSLAMDTSGVSNSSGNVDNTKTRVSVGTLYPSKKLDNILAKGVENNADSGSFDLLLSKHAQVETLEARVKVLGNPAVMGDLNTLPSGLGADSDGSTAFSDWRTGPPLIKINVYVPNNPNKLIVDDSFRKKFWYRGYYQVISTKHSFDGGVFTQEHDMISMSLEDPVVNTKPEDVN